MRVRDKTAIVVGAGQTPGETMGNGRATAILLAREGASVMLVDRRLDSARETQQMIEAEGGKAFAFEADITKEDDCRSVVTACVEQYGRIDILHNNVGIGGGSGIVDLDLAVWQRTMNVNLTGMFLMSKHTIPQMREQQAGSIVNISSVASIASTGMLAYKVSKAGVNALTHHIATGNARHGIRCNAILPGLMDTPMAVDQRARATGTPREQVASQRDRQVPLGGKMGTAWDVANAALFLHSDEAGFITGVLLPVDGGQSARVGG